MIRASPGGVDRSFAHTSEELMRLLTAVLVCIAAVLVGLGTAQAQKKKDIEMDNDPVASTPPSKTLERAIKLYDKKDFFSASIELKKVLDGESGDDAKNKQRAEFFMGKTLWLGKTRSRRGLLCRVARVLRQDRPGRRRTPTTVRRTCGSPRCPRVRPRRRASSRRSARTMPRRR
jgi:hypothetical protein